MTGVLLLATSMQWFLNEVCSLFFSSINWRYAMQLFAARVVNFMIVSELWVNVVFSSRLSGKSK